MERLSFTAKQDSDEEVVIGHQTSRRLRGIRSRLHRCSVHHFLPVALLGLKGQARAQHLDEGKARVLDRLNQDIGRTPGITTGGPGNEVGARAQRQYQGVERVHARPFRSQLA